MFLRSGLVSTFITAALLSSAAFAAPAQVILIRHAEKPDDDSAPGLSIRGFERADALPKLFQSDARLTDFGPPVAIYAAAPSKSLGSIRPQETVEPTAKALGLAVVTSYTAKDFEAMAADVLAKKAYEGKTVLISWTRDEIPMLAHELGLKKKKVAKWKSATFDRLWRFQYNSDGSLKDFSDLPQHLLSGDAAN